MDLNKKIGLLNNKMKYILLKNKCSSTTTILFTVKCGSKNERKGEYGLSHFIEHMLFKGTKKRLNSKNISNSLYNHGAEFNASTGYELTRYYTKINNDYIEVALDVLSDMLFNSVFDKEELEKEKDVVISENKMNRSSPTGTIDALSSTLIFKNTAYEHNIGGKDIDVENTTQLKMVKYFKHFYKPSNIIVSVCGNYKYSNTKMISLLNKYFGKKFSNYNKIIKNSKIPKYIMPKHKNFLTMNNKLGFRFKNLKRNLSQGYITILFPSYSINDNRSYIIEIIQNILGGNMSSRLFMKLREENGLVYSISAYNQTLSDTGVFEISCSTFGDEKRILKSIELILIELKRLICEKITKKELDNNKKYIIGNLLIDMEDSVSLSELYSDNLLLTGKYIPLNDIIKKIKKISINDINNVANILFKKNKCTICVLSKKIISQKKVKSIVDNIMK